MLALHLFFLSLVVNASPVIGGKVSLAGNGCYGETQILPVAGSSDLYTLPIKVKLVKKTGSPFERRNCNIRFPVALKANEKLVIADLSQVVQINGRDTKSTLNISVVGKRAKSLVATESQTLKFDGTLVESDCGKDAMVTGNLNLLSYGAGEVSASTEAVLVTIKVVNCNQL